MSSIPEVTHFIVIHKDEHGAIDMEDLYRANGMLCASRQKDIVRFGTDISTAQNRPFLNADMASKFLRVMAEVDLIAQEKMMRLDQVIDLYVTLPGAVNGEVTEPKAVIEPRTMESLHENLVLPVHKRIV